MRQRNPRHRPRIKAKTLRRKGTPPRNAVPRHSKGLGGALRDTGKNPSRAGRYRMAERTALGFPLNISGMATKTDSPTSIQVPGVGAKHSGKPGNRGTGYRKKKSRNRGGKKGTYNRRRRRG